MDADFTLIAIAHGDCEEFFVAAGGYGCGGLGLFDGEATLAEGEDDGVGEFDGGLGGGGEELGGLLVDSFIKR